MAEPEDTTDLARQVAVAAPSLAASRALSTAVALSRKRADAETVETIGDSLPQAARDGAFPAVREALRRLDELSAQAPLLEAISSARATLSDRQVLSDMCAAVDSEGDAAIAGEILAAAGPTGAEVLLDAYIAGPDKTRDLLRPVLRAMSEPVLGVARGRLRTEEPTRAIAIVRTLGVIGDRRAVPVIGQALGNLNETVRFAAITALAETPEPEAASALIKALGHPEPETQRFAVREIGRVKAAPAIHQLTRALEDLNVLQRTYETKKEVIRALEQIGTPEARTRCTAPPTERSSWGRKSRELRAQARAALEHIEACRPSHEELTRRDGHPVPPGERRPARRTGRARRRDEVRRRPGAVRHAREARARARPRAHAGRRRHQRRALPDHAPARGAVARRPGRCGARARDLRLRGRHRQHLQGHALRREPGLPRGERHLPQAHRGAARQGHLGGHVLLLDDRRGGRRAHRPARRHRGRRHRRRPRVPRGPRRPRHLARRDHRARRHGRRGAQPRGARAGARELRRRHGRDARHRVAGQAGPRHRGRPAPAVSSSRCSTTCCRIPPPSSA